ncbi:MAG: hypothetical protein FWF57_08275 [Defluviitaleaceae bacterium]|nr:hypothetical protein [Defluviitaleaceae bacterium]
MSAEIDAKLEDMAKKFEKMNTNEKKDYIENLRTKPIVKSNIKYNKFLNECIKKYNDEVSQRPSSKTDIENITRLWQSFNLLKTNQKLEFIEGMKAKLDGINNVDYADFLNECIRKYNDELFGTKTSTEPKAISNVFEKKSKKKN